MKILLTGGAGYIGSHTAVVLSQAGHEVILYDNFCNSDRSVLLRLKQILDKSLPCIEGDVRDLELLKQTLQQYDIQAVIHFAGLKAVAESVLNPIKYFDNNVVGSIRLIQAMQESGVRTLVFSSSATVYGEPEYLPYDEDHPTHPINPYGQSKLQVESTLQAVSASDPAWRISVLRYFNPVGAHESGLIGEDPSGTPNNLMPFVAQVASGQLPVLQIYGNDYDTRDGTGERDYIHVMDLAEGHLAALNHLLVNPGHHVFNLGSGDSISVLELVHEFELVTGLQLPHQWASRRAGDIAVSVANPAKAKQSLHWQTRKTLKDMCTSTWKWQQAQSKRKQHHDSR